MQNATNGLWVDSIHSSTVLDPSIDNTVGVRPKKILVVAIRGFVTSETL